MNDKTTLPVKKYRLKEFIENFIEKNTLIRLWYKISTGHKEVIENDKPIMEWELVKSEYADRIVIGVTDILYNHSRYKEAVNIVIEQPDTKEKEMIRVVGVGVNSDNKYQGYFHVNTNLNNVPKDKFPAIRQAIENVLNGEEKISTNFIELHNKYYPHQKVYSKSELEEAESKAFNAGRDRIGGWWNEQIKNWKYPTLNDYRHRLPEKSLNTINKEEKTKEQELIWFVNSYWEVHSKVKDTHHPADNPNNITVKDKEDGERYVLENKPCLSLNDCAIGIPKRDFEQLTEIAKQKLKQ